MNRTSSCFLSSFIEVWLSDKNCIYLRCMWCFDIFQSSWLTYLSPQLTFLVCVVYSLSKFQVHVINCCYHAYITRLPELFHLITESLYCLTNISPNSPPLETTILFSVTMSLTFLDSTCKWDLAIFSICLSLSLAYLT